MITWIYNFVKYLGSLFGGWIRTDTELRLENSHLKTQPGAQDGSSCRMQGTTEYMICRIIYLYLYIILYIWDYRIHIYIYITYMWMFHLPAKFVWLTSCSVRSPTNKCRWQKSLRFSDIKTPFDLNNIDHVRDQKTLYLYPHAKYAYIYIHIHTYTYIYTYGGFQRWGQKP